MTKITDMEFLVSNSGIFIILRNFAISQIWGCWFQIKWYYFQIPAQKYINEAFLVQNLKIFIFASNLTSRQIPKRWLQIWQEYFQIPAPKYRNLAFLFPNFKDFYFLPQTCNKANSRVLIANMTMTFRNCRPKHPNNTFRT